MNLTLFGHRVVTPEALREWEAGLDEKWRKHHAEAVAEAMYTANRMRREAEALRASAERECEQMKAECRRSIRRQYEAFDREWREREDRTQARVAALEAELARVSLHLRTHSDKGQKLLALAVDRRTPEQEAVVAFLKAREQGIRLHHG